MVPANESQACRHDDEIQDNYCVRPVDKVVFPVIFSVLSGKKLLPEEKEVQRVFVPLCEVLFSLRFILVSMSASDFI